MFHLLFKKKLGKVKRGKEQTFENLYSPKENSFDLMRFILATFVIYTHSFPLFYGSSSPGDKLARWTNGQLDMGVVAVSGFFVISGFLITQSILNSSNYFTYIIKRVLRIFPAFFVSLLLVALLVGPIVSDLDLYSYYFKDYVNGPLNFIVKNIFLNITGYSWVIHDVFSGNPFPSGINGSMWTLKHEFAAYLLLIPLSFFYFLKYRKLLLLFTFGVLVLAILNIQNNFALVNLVGSKWWVLSDNEYSSAIKYLYYFLAGSLIFLYKDRIYFSPRFILLAILVLIIASKLFFLKYVLLFILPYMIISISICFSSSFMKKYGDFSYGLYIYAFPVQQLIAHLFIGNLNVKGYFLLSFLITLAISVLSWKYIEKPILSLKHKFKITKLNDQEAMKENQIIA